MNFFNKTRILLGAVIILTAINLAVLGTVGYHLLKPSKTTQSVTSSEIQRTRFMAKELNLSSDQNEEFEKIRNEFRVEEQQVKNAIRENHRLTMMELAKDSPSKQTLDSLTNDIGRLHCKHHQITIVHFSKVKGIAANPDQQEHFRRMFFRMMNRGQMDQHRKYRQEQRREKRFTNDE